VRLYDRIEDGRDDDGISMACFASWTCITQHRYGGIAFCWSCLVVVVTA
jgi:hypothetical protein